MKIGAFLSQKLRAMNENTHSLACSSEGKWRFLALSSPPKREGRTRRRDSGVAGRRGGGVKVCAGAVRLPFYPQTGSKITGNPISLTCVQHPLNEVMRCHCQAVV